MKERGDPNANAGPWYCVLLLNWKPIDAVSIGVGAGGGGVEGGEGLLKEYPKGGGGDLKENSTFRRNCWKSFIIPAVVDLSKLMGGFGTITPSIPGTGLRCLNHAARITEPWNH